jgi:hypothetical protein
MEEFNLFSGNKTICLQIFPLKEINKTNKQNTVLDAVKAVGLNICAEYSSF